MHINNFFYFKKIIALFILFNSNSFFFYKNKYIFNLKSNFL